jgi:hypothetical protein
MADFVRLRSDLSHLLRGQPGLRKRVTDLALRDRLLDGIVGIGGFEISDDGGRRGFDPDNTPLTTSHAGSAWACRKHSSRRSGIRVSRQPSPIAVERRSEGCLGILEAGPQPAEQTAAGQDQAPSGCRSADARASHSRLLWRDEGGLYVSLEDPGARDRGYERSSVWHADLVVDAVKIDSDCARRQTKLMADLLVR